VPLAAPSANLSGHPSPRLLSTASTILTAKWRPFSTAGRARSASSPRSSRWPRRCRRCSARLRHARRAPGSPRRGGAFPRRARKTR
jgi:hypothetical protein